RGGAGARARRRPTPLRRQHARRPSRDLLGLRRQPRPHRVGPRRPRAHRRRRPLQRGDLGRQPPLRLRLDRRRPPLPPPHREVWVLTPPPPSVPIVDVAPSPPRVTRTLLVCDEPRDIVFAG